MRRGQIFEVNGEGFTSAVAHGGAAPILYRRAAEEAQGSGFRWVDLVIVPPGADIGPHAHAPDSEEMYVVIEGEGRMLLDDREVTVGPGHVVLNAPGGTHALTSTGPAPMKLVVVEVRPRSAPEGGSTRDAAGAPAGVIHAMRCAAERRYPIRLAPGLLDPGDTTLAATLAGRRALVVTTPNVDRLYGERLRALLERQGLDASVMILDCSEDRKSLRQVAAVCEEALRRGLDRRSVLVGFGGGVCTDVVSVAASLIRRGLAHVRIPTTLIGQIDAGVGVKGAVNFAGKKSHLGCFHPPEAVLLEPAFLRTLPQALLRAGMAEIIKVAVVRDRALFELVVTHQAELCARGFAGPEPAAEQVIRGAALRMLEELEQNPYEDRTYKRLVDFGHTFSPQLEAACDFAMHHGQAVAIDVALSATIGEALGLCGGADRDRVVSALRAAGLPIWSRLLTAELCAEALREAARHRGGSPNLVVPVEIGRATFVERVEDVPLPLLEGCLARLAREAAEPPPHGS